MSPYRSLYSSLHYIPFEENESAQLQVQAKLQIIHLCLHVLNPLHTFFFPENRRESQETERGEMCTRRRGDRLESTSGQAPTVPTVGIQELRGRAPARRRQSTTQRSVGSLVRPGHRHGKGSGNHGNPETSRRKLFEVGDQPFKISDVDGR